MAEPATCPRSLLLVDDDPGIRDSLAELLRDEGYEVACAEDGEAALAELRRRQAPCLILLDIMMPRMDGHGFRAEQQRDPALAPIPVIVISASRARRELAQQMAADGCLEKPIDINQLLETVARFC